MRVLFAVFVRLCRRFNHGIEVGDGDSYRASASVLADGDQELKRTLQRAGFDTFMEGIGRDVAREKGAHADVEFRLSSIFFPPLEFAALALHGDARSDVLPAACTCSCSRPSRRRAGAASARSPCAPRSASPTRAAIPTALETMTRANAMSATQRATTAASDGGDGREDRWFSMIREPPIPAAEGGRASWTRGFDAGRCVLNGWQTRNGYGRKKTRPRAQLLPHERPPRHRKTCSSRGPRSARSAPKNDASVPMGRTTRADAQPMGLSTRTRSSTTRTQAAGELRCRGIAAERAALAGDGHDAQPTPVTFACRAPRPSGAGPGRTGTRTGTPSPRGRCAAAAARRGIGHHTGAPAHNTFSYSTSSARATHGQPVGRVVGLDVDALHRAGHGDVAERDAAHAVAVELGVDRADARADADERRVLDRHVRRAREAQRRQPAGLIATESSALRTYTSRRTRSRPPTSKPSVLPPTRARRSAAA